MTYQINGVSGKYDGFNNMDPSIKYGKNASENFKTHIQSPLVNDNYSVPPIFDFSFNPEAVDENLEHMEEYIDSNDKYLASLPPLEYEYRYMPNLNVGEIDKKAVLAVAKEDMMGEEELSVKEFEERFLVDQNMTAEPIDINKDGKITTSEYATTVIAADILSKDTTDVTKVDGVINTKGLNAILEYSQKANAVKASELYTRIYNTYNLAE